MALLDCLNGEKTSNKKQCCLWCVIFFLATGCLVASFACAVRARSQFNAFAEAFGQFAASWDSDLVYGIFSTNTAPVPDSSYYYITWNGTWPGNIAGCNCGALAIVASGGYYAGLYTDSCSWNQTLHGCTDIAAGPKVYLNKWINNQVIYALKKSGTGFLSTYKNMNDDGSCKSGFTNCGNPNSASKGVCLPSGTTCPITDISSTGGPGYTQAGTFTGFSLYTSTANTQNPVSDLYIGEDHMCFVRSMYPITPKRSVYKLLMGDFNDCILDKNAWSISQLGEATFLGQNSVDTTRLIGYGASDTFLYKLLAARTIDWSPTCSSNVQAILDQPNQLISTKKQYLILFVIYIISFVFGCLAILMSAAMYCTSDPKWKLHKQVFCGRVICWLLVIPSIFICTIQVNQFVNSFTSISELNCSNDNTNNDFKETGQKIKWAIGTFNIVTIVLSFFGMFFESINFCMTVRDSNVLQAPPMTNGVSPDPAGVALRPLPNNSESGMNAKPRYENNFGNDQFMGQSPAYSFATNNGSLPSTNPGTNFGPTPQIQQPQIVSPPVFS